MIYFIVISALVLIIFAIVGITTESKAFNGGYCKKCGKKLKYFDSDSNGGRGYVCESCGYNTWVSYRCVDGNIIKH